MELLKGLVPFQFGSEKRINNMFKTSVYKVFNTKIILVHLLSFLNGPDVISLYKSGATMTFYIIEDFLELLSKRNITTSQNLMRELIVCLRHKESLDGSRICTHISR